MEKRKSKQGGSDVKENENIFTEKEKIIYTKTYLENFQVLLHEEKNIEDALLFIEMRKKFPSACYNGSFSGGVNSDLSDYFVKLEEKTKELMKKRLEIIDTYTEILEGIHEMKDKEEGECLHMFYIKGYRAERIAKELGYGKRQVYRIRDKALMNYKIKDVTKCH